MGLDSCRPVSSASPSVHLLYGADVDLAGYTVIGVSQSGRTPEIAGVRARLHGRDTDFPAGLTKVTST